MSFQRHRDALEYLPDVTKFGIERLYRVLNNRVTRHLPYPPLKSQQHPSGLPRLPLEFQEQRFALAKTKRRRGPYYAREGVWMLAATPAASKMRSDVATPVPFLPLLNGSGSLQPG